MIEKDQAQMLATLACAARPRGARRWDPAGVVAAIAKVRHLPLEEVTAATMRAAGDRTLDTPGAIGNTTTSCWRTQPGETTSSATSSEPYDPNGMCQICGKTRFHCERNPHADHAYETRDEMLHQRSTTQPSLKTADEDPLLTYLERSPE